MIEIIEKISSDLLLPYGDVWKSVEQAQRRTRKIKVPKRSGGHRTISQPTAAVKPILAWLNAKLLSLLPVSSIATAFRPKISILENANRHKDSGYSIRIDISDFFPSITYNDLISTINSAGTLPNWATTPSAFSVLRLACFDKNDSLPIGYPTSPSIANSVMFELDSFLLKLLDDKKKFGDAHLTRYADDFVFSSELKGACKSFFDDFSLALSKNTRPHLLLNSKKTRYMSKAGGSTIITGLRVNNQGNVVAHGDYRDHVRLLLKLYKENKLKQEDIPKLIGHLAYVEHIDPALFTKLSFKFYEEIGILRASYNKTVS